VVPLEIKERLAPLALRVTLDQPDRLDLLVQMVPGDRTEIQDQPDRRDLRVLEVLQVLRVLRESPGSRD